MIFREEWPKGEGGVLVLAKVDGACNLTYFAITETNDNVSSLYQSAMHNASTTQSKSYVGLCYARICYKMMLCSIR